MARPLRYEAAGAVYHVMARGDGGKPVFEDDKDRYGWMDLMERACGSFGWRVHAWVLMGNHFHLLVETPEPNLVAGMKWMLGVYSQGWNRRRQRQGTCVPRALQGGGGQRRGARRVAISRSWRITFISIRCGPAGWVARRASGCGAGGGAVSRHTPGARSPEWLETERVLRAFQLSEDHRGGRAYAGYLEARAKDAKGAVTDAALKELRRGWCLGERSFAEKVLEALAGGARPKRRKGSVAGAAARAHDEAEAERLAVAALRALDAPTEASQLFGKGKWVDETAVVAALIRKRTGVRNRWVAERLGMGHEGNVTRAIRRVNEYPAWKSRLRNLEAMLVSRD